VTAEEGVLEALQRAAEQLGESPTKAQYEELGLTPASATIMEILDGWNAAKESAGLETFDPCVTGGHPIQPKPDWVDIPDDAEWQELTGQQRWYYKNREERIVAGRRSVSGSIRTKNGIASVSGAMKIDRLAWIFITQTRRNTVSRRWLSMATRRRVFARKSSAVSSSVRIAIDWNTTTQS